MFDKILIHDSTRSALQALAKQPPQGLLFVGPQGVGKLTLATA
jgi:SpoVK/Ycf46/Vps4 family AAA+-type ATPase